MPAKAGIQYAAAVPSSQMSRRTGSSAFADDDSRGMPQVQCITNKIAKILAFTVVYIHDPS
jgi:hypothetical protein